jgi:hypothetical protein
MRADEWRAVLEREPLTGDQRGRIMGEFTRLGFHPRYDRAERLRLTAELARSGPIGSVKELTMGEAGRTVGTLTRCRTARDLYAIAEPAGGPELAGWIAALAALFGIIRNSPESELWRPALTVSASPTPR